MKTIAMILALTIATPVAFIACDRTVETQTKTTTDDKGSTEVQKKTVTENPNGDVTVTKEKKSVDTH